MAINNNTNENIQKTSIDMTDDQNEEEEDQFSSEILFEPLRSLLSDIIHQNKQLREEINQIKEQNKEQTKKNEDLQLQMNQIEEQNQLRHENLLQQLKDITDLYAECNNQLNEQMKKNEEHQNSINRLQTNDENQNTQILETNQHHHQLEINIKALRPMFKYLPYTKWKQDGITVAGGNGQGNQLNQLNRPRGISIDDDQTIYIADWWNHRIVKWKYNATNGEVVAGGNREESQTNRLSYPRDVIIDKETDSLIFCDEGKKRVMQQSRQNDRNREVIISDIDCGGVAMGKDGSLYVSDCRKNEVRRWRRGENGNGALVAGGNGKGHQLNQLNNPDFIFVDDNYSLYVSDFENNRVMKWVKDATAGIVVAGGNGQGNSLTQLYSPRGVIVDQLCQVYVADRDNDRVVRWCRGAKEGSVIVGGNGQGQQSNQLHCPTDLSFDGQGNLYVVDRGNDRIQKFEIDSE